MCFIYRLAWQLVTPKRSWKRRLLQNLQRRYIYTFIYLQHYHLIYFIQVQVALEIEERLPLVRLYFTKKNLVVYRNHRSFSHKHFLSGTSFDSKVKAVNESNEINSNLIEGYQVKAVDCYHCVFVAMELLCVTCS